MQSQVYGSMSAIPQKRKPYDDDYVHHNAPSSTDVSDDDERDELDEDEPTAYTHSTSSSILPQFQEPAEESSPRGDHTMPRKPVNEYEAGRVVCEVCGEGVSIRDERTGVFSVAKWNEHRSSCSAAKAKKPVLQDPVIMTPESTAVVLASRKTNPSANRRKRRPKRSEEQRIEFFRTDPHVAKFEAYRVLCGGCNKWIRLRSNSSYCSIPWEAHRKSCLAKKSAQGKIGPEQRRKVFVNDPEVREYEESRVLCNTCGSWVVVCMDDNRQAIIQWNQHKYACSRAVSASPPSPPPSERTKTESPRYTFSAVGGVRSSLSSPNPNSGFDQVPPPSKGQLAYVCLSSTTPSSATSPMSSADLNDVRRRNAEQRAAILEKDPLIGQVEPLRVFCTLCQKWIHLRKDLPFCSYPWSQHKSKCVRRHEKTIEKQAEGKTECPDSARSVKLDYTQENPKAKRIKLEHPEPDLHSDEDDPSENRDSVDLESNAGRTAFICQSVEYLFRTTYSRGDEMTIALLVTYLNSTLPPDKYEEFDTVEVARVAAANPLFKKKKGRFVFEGDVVRLAD